MIYFYILGILVLLTPLVMMVYFLWKHHKENGEVSQLRKIIGVLALVKILYFINVSAVLIKSISIGRHLPDWVLFQSACGTWLLAITNWWAYHKVKKLLFS